MIFSLGNRLKFFGACPLIKAIEPSLAAPNAESSYTSTNTLDDLGLSASCVAKVPESSSGSSQGVSASCPRQSTSR